MCIFLFLKTQREKREHNGTSKRSRGTEGRTKGVRVEKRVVVVRVPYAHLIVNNRLSHKKCEGGVKKNKNQFSAPLPPLVFSLFSFSSLVHPTTMEDIAMSIQTHAERETALILMREFESLSFLSYAKKRTFNTVNRTTETERYSSHKSNCQLARYSRPAQLVPTLDDDETDGSHPHIYHSIKNKKKHIYHSLKIQPRSLPHLIHSSCPPWVISGALPNSFGVHGACSAAWLVNWKMYYPFSCYSHSHSHSHATCASKLFLSYFACTGEFFSSFLGYLCALYV